MEPVDHARAAHASRRRPCGRTKQYVQVCGSLVSACVDAFKSDANVAVGAVTNGNGIINSTSLCAAVLACYLRLESDVNKNALTVDAVGRREGRPS